MTRVMFHGSPAWVGAIHGETLCDWWSRDPGGIGWDRMQLRPLDLARTASAARAGQLPPAEIEVDDHTTSGGRTTIGPLWPDGATIGAAWVTASYLARVGWKVPPDVPAGGSGHGYEYTTVEYFDGEERDRRFHGFHANVRQVQATLSLVELWSPGTGAGGAAPVGAWWLDLAAVADPKLPPLAVGVPGAVLLDAPTVALLATIIDPKLPPFRGGFGFPPDPGTR
jgi:hypothetical protein